MGGAVSQQAQVDQLSRMAASLNGNANKVTAALASTEGELKLSIEDDGAGFPLEQLDPRPWSISGRIDKLGGRLSVSTGPGGTTLDISIPEGTCG